MKQLTFAACTFLTFFLLSGIAHSEVQIEDLANAVEKQVKTLNAQNAWQLYFPQNKLGIEMFYDSINIHSPYAGHKIVTTKTKYNDSNFLGKLKKSRSINHEVMGADSGKLNYNNIFYTIQSIQLNCSQNEFMIMEVIADFDNNHNLINLLPSVRSQFSHIMANSSYNTL